MTIIKFISPLVPLSHVVRSESEYFANFLFSLKIITNNSKDIFMKAS